MIHVYMQQEMHSPSGGKYVQHKKAVTERAKRAEFFYQQRNTFRTFQWSERSERSLTSTKKSVAAERAKRAELFLFAINIH